MIGEVLSRVETPREVFRDVVREWEEECAEYFGVPIRRIMTSARPEGKKSSAQKLKPFLFSVAKKILLAVPPLKNALWDKRRPELSQDIGSPLSLCFIMNNEEVPAYLNSNCLPVFLDVWSDWALMELVRRTKKLRLFYVTYLELYRRVNYPRLKKRGLPNSSRSALQHFCFRLTSSPKAFIPCVPQVFLLLKNIIFRAACISLSSLYPHSH